MVTKGYKITTYKGSEFMERGDDSLHQFRAKVRALKRKMREGGIKNAEFRLIVA